MRSFGKPISSRNSRPWAFEEPNLLGSVEVILLLGSAVEFLDPAASGWLLTPARPLIMSREDDDDDVPAETAPAAPSDEWDGGGAPGNDHQSAQAVDDDENDVSVEDAERNETGGGANPPTTNGNSWIGSVEPSESGHHNDEEIGTVPEVTEPSGTRDPPQYIMSASSSLHPGEKSQSLEHKNDEMLMAVDEEANDDSLPGTIVEREPSTCNQCPKTHHTSPTATATIDPPSATDQTENESSADEVQRLSLLVAPPAQDDFSSPQEEKQSLEPSSMAEIELEHHQPMAVDADANDHSLPGTIVEREPSTCNQCPETHHASPTTATIDPPGATEHTEHESSADEVKRLLVAPPAQDDFSSPPAQDDFSSPKDEKQSLEPSSVDEIELEHHQPLANNVTVNVDLTEGTLEPPLSDNAIPVPDPAATQDDKLHSSLQHTLSGLGAAGVPLLEEKAAHLQDPSADGAEQQSLEDSPVADADPSEGTDNMASNVKPDAVVDPATAHVVSPTIVDDREHLSLLVNVSKDMDVLSAGLSEPSTLENETTPPQPGIGSHQQPLENASNSQEVDVTEAGSDPPASTAKLQTLEQSPPIEHSSANGEVPSGIVCSNEDAQAVEAALENPPQLDSSASGVGQYPLENAAQNERSRLAISPPGEALVTKFEKPSRRTADQATEVAAMLPSLDQTLTLEVPTTNSEFEHHSMLDASKTKKAMATSTEDTDVSPSLPRPSPTEDVAMQRPLENASQIPSDPSSGLAEQHSQDSTSSANAIQSENLIDANRVSGNPSVDTAGKLPLDQHVMCSSIQAPALEAAAAILDNATRVKSELLDVEAEQHPVDKEPQHEGNTPERVLENVSSQKGGLSASASEPTSTEQTIERVRDPDFDANTFQSAPQSELEIPATLRQNLKTDSQNDDDFLSKPDKLDCMTNTSALKSLNGVTPSEIETPEAEIKQQRLEMEPLRKSEEEMASGSVELDVVPEKATYPSKSVTLEDASQLELAVSAAQFDKQPKPEGLKNEEDQHPVSGTAENHTLEDSILAFDIEVAGGTAETAQSLDEVAAVIEQKTTEKEPQSEKNHPPDFSLNVSTLAIPAPFGTNVDEHKNPKPNIGASLIPAQNELELRTKTHTPGSIRGESRGECDETLTSASSEKDPAELKARGILKNNDDQCPAADGDVLYGDMASLPCSLVDPSTTQDKDSLYIDPKRLLATGCCQAAGNVPAMMEVGDVLDSLQALYDCQRNELANCEGELECHTARITNHTEETNKLLVLVSNLALKREVTSNQQMAYTILEAARIPYEVIDGSDTANLSRRNELFQLSGLRGQYPQFFQVKGGTNGTTFVGDWEYFQMANECGTLRRDFGTEEAVLKVSPLESTQQNSENGSGNKTGHAVLTSLAPEPEKALHHGSDSNLGLSQDMASASLKSLSAEKSSWDVLRDPCSDPDSISDVDPAVSTSPSGPSSYHTQATEEEISRVKDTAWAKSHQTVPNVDRSTQNSTLDGSEALKSGRSPIPFKRSVVVPEVFSIPGGDEIEVRDVGSNRTSQSLKSQMEEAIEATSPHEAKSVGIPPGSTIELQNKNKVAVPADFCFGCKGDRAALDDQPRKKSVTVPAAFLHGETRAEDSKSQSKSSSGIGVGSPSRKKLTIPSVFGSDANRSTFPLKGFSQKSPVEPIVLPRWNTRGEQTGKQGNKLPVQSVLKPTIHAIDLSNGESTEASLRENQSDVATIKVPMPTESAANNSALQGHSAEAVWDDAQVLSKPKKNLLIPSAFTSCDNSSNRNSRKEISLPNHSDSRTVTSPIGQGRMKPGTEEPNEVEDTGDVKEAKLGSAAKIRTSWGTNVPGKLSIPKSFNHQTDIKRADGLSPSVSEVGHLNVSGAASNSAVTSCDSQSVRQEGKIGDILSLGTKTMPSTTNPQQRTQKKLKIPSAFLTGSK